MPNKFNMTLAPFDRLSEQQQKQLRSNLDVAYFRQSDTILTPGKCDENLYILIKGGVEETSDDGEEIFAHYAHEDIFDVRSLLDGTLKHRYTALEDTLTYLLPRHIFLSFYQQNTDFAAYFDNNLSARQQRPKQAHHQQNLAEFILTKIDDSIYTPALVLESDTSIKQVVEQMQQQACDAALIPLSSQDHTKNTLPFGIITRTDLLHAIALNQYSLDTPAKSIAHFPVLHVPQGKYLFDAMIIMTRYKCKRLVVTQNNNIVGMLNITQVLSAFSTHSHVLTLRIANASNLEELALAANKQRERIGRAHV